MTPDLLIGIGIGLAIGILGSLTVLDWEFNLGPKEILDAGEEAHAEPPAKAIDPNDPPSWRVYAPKRIAGPPVICTCHGLPLTAGQPILWWPVPDGEPGQVDLLCEEGAGIEAPVDL